MSELSTLIEQLYQEGIERGGLDKQPAMMTSVSDEKIISEEEIHATRLLRVAREMAALLRQEDQPNLNQPAPSQEARLLILNHWESMMQKMAGIRQHMQSLEQDILKMQPWGNFDVMKVEQLAQHGCHIRFWTLDSATMEQQKEERWFVASSALIVANDGETAHFVTVTMGQERPIVPPEAIEVELCPSPVSTLIMLQTRDKDSLKRLDTLLGDYALCHYGEVYAALRCSLPEGAEMPEIEPDKQNSTLTRLWAKISGKIKVKS